LSQDKERGGAKEGKIETRKLSGCKPPILQRSAKIVLPEMISLRDSMIVETSYKAGGSAPHLDSSKPESVAL
jgi:hypothetical protein